MRIINSCQYLILCSRIIASQIESLSFGSALPQLTVKGISTLKIPLPPSIAEQQAVADALSDADALVESLEQPIAKKCQIKQSAMQELLTGKRRLPGFSGKWEVKRLGELGSFIKGHGVSRDDSSSGDLSCVRCGEIYTKHNDFIKTCDSRISRDVAETATHINAGDILFTGSVDTKEEIGKWVVFIEDIGDAGGDIVILRAKDDDPLSLGFYLNTEPINRQKSGRGQGDAIVHISSTALADIDDVFPERSEQTAIATILSDMDAEIDGLKARVAKAGEIKQGMMQDMLNGRMRQVWKSPYYSTTSIAATWRFRSFSAALFGMATRLEVVHIALPPPPGRWSTRLGHRIQNGGPSWRRAARGRRSESAARLPATHNIALSCGARQATKVL